MIQGPCVLFVKGLFKIFLKIWSSSKSNILQVMKIKQVIRAEKLKTESYKPPTS